MLNIQPQSISTPVLYTIHKVNQALCAIAYKIVEIFISCMQLLKHTWVNILQGMTLCISRVLTVSQQNPGGLIINTKRLNIRPNPIDSSSIHRVLEALDQPIQKEEILQLYDQIFGGIPEGTVLCNDQGSLYTKRAGRQAFQTRYITDISQRIGRGQGYNRVVAENIETYLKGIIFELRKETIPLQEKREALIGLMRASFHCLPRRHEEARKTYLTLCRQMETVEQIILRSVQQAKETFFLNYYSLSTEPVQTLNYIRSTVGDLFGLDPDPLSHQDPFIALNDARGPNNPNTKHSTFGFIRTFNTFFTPSAVIQLVKTSLSARLESDNALKTELSAYIDAEIRRHARMGDLGNEEVEALPAPYQNSDYTLTDEGVKFLLVHFKVLNCNPQNSHLVRMSRPTLPSQP